MKIAALRTLVQRRTGHLYDSVFTRRVSVFITAGLAPLGVTPNQVSTMGILVGVTACLLTAFGRGWVVIVGVLLVHLVAVLDSVDGELARLRRQFSLKGLFLEDLSAFYMIVAFPVAVGFHVFRAGAGSLPLVLAILFGCFGRNAMAAARRALLKSMQTKRPVRTPASPSSSGVGGGIRRMIEEHLLNHTNIWVVLSTVLLVETLIGKSPTTTAAVTSVLMVGLFAKEAATLVHLLRQDTLDTLLWQLYKDAKVSNMDASQVDPMELARY